MSDDIHIALLRAINVGGNNKLPMKDLAALFLAAGCTEVKTYIQSGNVVFKANRELAKKVPQVIAAAILKRFGHTVPVVTRTAKELADVARKNPFLAAGSDTDRLYVAFLADVPKASSVAALDMNRSPPDELAVRGRDIYLRLLNGGGTSKLTNAYFDKALATTSTLRNWRTVLKLIEMTAP